MIKKQGQGLSGPYKIINIVESVILSPFSASTLELKALEVFVEEIYKRTGVKIQITHSWPETNKTVIIIGSEASAREMIASYAYLVKDIESAGPEGYRILVNEVTPIIFVLGADSRGVLYGVGKLLRNLILKHNYIGIRSDFKVSSTPRHSLRGHQLGYRPKTNAYDAWSVEQFDQYIRELAIFGANSIEIMPPRTDDDLTGPHMKLPAFEMMIKLSEIIDSYGLDVWIWYPNMAEDYTDPNTISMELAEREEIFSNLPRINHVFIPGGDPGHLEPNVLFTWCGKVAELLNRYHANAKIWLSPQFFRLTDEWLNSFYANVKKEPEWLGGIVFGPWEKDSITKLRETIPDKYPIRHYPDITHSLRCQYPVHRWDRAYAMTYGRECINPRPFAQKHIHNLFHLKTIGSLTYSEGINDDVNKFVWSDQDWNPETPVVETLRDYSRFFISPDYVEEIAQGIISLEKNWEGPLLLNEGVEVTLKQWQTMEVKMKNLVHANYRFQMGLLRAYYDAYIRRRLIYETELEKKAMGVLHAASSLGSIVALNKMRNILRRAWEDPVGKDLRERCDSLADALFENIGFQLSVKKHGAQSWNRGAFMDTIDMPLNNSHWLLTQSRIISEIKDEKGRLKAIDGIVNRTNPGPGGHYYNFSQPKSWDVLSKGLGWKVDPGNISSPQILYAVELLHRDEHWKQQFGGIPLEWIGNAATIYDTPLSITLDSLHVEACYTIKITYIGFFGTKIKLVANENCLIHDFIDINNRCTSVEFKIPSEALTDEKLELKWESASGERGVQVAEIWLMKNKVI